MLLAQALVGRPSRTCSPGERRWPGRCGCSASSATSNATLPGSTAHWQRTPPRWSPTCGETSTAPHRPAGPCSTSEVAPAISRPPSPTPVCSTSASSPTPVEMHAGPARFDEHEPPTCGRPAWRCRSPTPAWTSACRPTSPSTYRSRGGSGREMLRVTRPGGLAVLSYTVWLGPFGGHEMGLSHYLGGARAAERYTRKHGHRPKNDYGSSLFAVSVSDGLRLGGEHRRARRRISSLPPAMGMVDDGCSGAEGVHGEQSGAGPAAVVSRPNWNRFSFRRNLGSVTLMTQSVETAAKTPAAKAAYGPSTTSCSLAASGSNRRPPRSSRSSRPQPVRRSGKCRWPSRPTSNAACAAARKAFDEGPWPHHAARRARRGARRAVKLLEDRADCSSTCWPRRPVSRRPSST